MGLHEKLVGYNRVFFSSEKFGEPITLRLGGQEDKSIRFDGVWDADSLPGTNEVEGDGVVVERATGRQFRESLTIEMPASVASELDERRVPPDAFERELDGETVLLKRILGRDAAVMTVRCIRTLEQYTRREARRG